MNYKDVTINNKSIGNVPVYATANTEGVQYGISYRLWLIGMIASTDPKISTEAPKYIIHQADEIIRLLDELEAYNE